MRHPGAPAPQHPPDGLRLAFRAMEGRQRSRFVATAEGHDCVSAYHLQRKRGRRLGETRARDGRDGGFAEGARRRNGRTICVAHHADELVESFLFNLFRGAGSAWLAAMREISTRRIDGVDLTIARPFLCVWRKGIDDYVGEHRLRFREDATNQNLTPLRNRIRHRIIPYLE